MSTQTERIHDADRYLGARTGCYSYRCVRYDAALSVMRDIGLTNRHTVIDVGSGWGEFGARMHTSRKGWCSRPRYTRTVP